MIDEKAEVGLQTEDNVSKNKLAAHGNDGFSAGRSQQQLIGKGEKTPAFKSAALGPERRSSPCLADDGRPNNSSHPSHISDQLSPPIQSLGAFDITEEPKAATHNDAAERSDENESSFEQQ